MFNNYHIYRFDNSTSKLIELLKTKNKFNIFNIKNLYIGEKNYKNKFLSVLKIESKLDLSKFKNIIINDLSYKFLDPSNKLNIDNKNFKINIYNNIIKL